MVQSGSIVGVLQRDSIVELQRPYIRNIPTYNFVNKAVKGRSTGSYLTDISVNARDSQIYRLNRNRLSAPLQLC